LEGPPGGLFGGRLFPGPKRVLGPGGIGVRAAVESHASESTRKKESQRDDQNQSIRAS
jgi:hypothetical protein